MFVKRFQPLPDGLLVVVHSAGRQTAVGKSLDHGLVADLEVQDQRARVDLLFKLDPLSHFARISVDEKSLGRRKLGQHCFLTRQPYNPDKIPFKRF